MIRLGVNIDHVATVRNARGEKYPDPYEAALLAKKAGATEEEMKITVQIAAEVARVSTLLYGNEWPLPRSK